MPPFSSQQTWPFFRRHFFFSWPLFCLVLPLLSCAEDKVTVGRDSSVDRDVEDELDLSEGPLACHFPGDVTFSDHSWRDIESLACFFALAGETEAPESVKYLILEPKREPALQHPLRFLSSDFYRLHDEWYWFRLLNGKGIGGLDVAPLSGLHFESIEEIYETYEGQRTLPLDLAFSEGFSGRLFSREFYRLAGFQSTASEPPENPAFFWLGSLLHYAADARRRVPEEIWAFMLEYEDRSSEEDLFLHFSYLEAHLPEEIGKHLRWLTRSSSQEALAASFEALYPDYKGRSLAEKDLVIEGEVVVYNEGITAGHVARFPSDFSPSLLRHDSLALISKVPDSLPITRAILSSVPQTPLAHVNLLAKARGTPNAYVAELFQEDGLFQGADDGALVVLQAKDQEIRWKALSEDDYAHYLSLKGKAPPSISQVDLDDAPYLMDLGQHDASEMHELVPLIGGKAAGFLSFLGEGNMPIPGVPMAISIRAYHEHMQPLLPRIQALLEEGLFQSDPRVRYLLLEGEEAYLKAHVGDPQSDAFLRQFKSAFHEGFFHELLLDGGVKGLILNQDIAGSTLATLHAGLRSHFSWLSNTQGLRFRSSSTAEDVSGFNGAGLYESETGFLYPSALSDASLRKKTLSRALQKVWATYWDFKPFEERANAGIDHFSGNMALVVHPRFDDAYELLNAVVTASLGRYLGHEGLDIVINVQKGAHSVTNPDESTESPEIIRILRDGLDGDWQITREASSSLSELPLLSEEELQALAEAVQDHAEHWLQVSNLPYPPSEAAQTLVLDYELKKMAAPWPSLASGEASGERLVWKQARVLDQGDRTQSLRDPFYPDFSLTEALPMDMRRSLRRLDVLRCVSENYELLLYAAFNEESLSQWMPFSTEPFLYLMRLKEHGEVGFESRHWTDFATDGPRLSEEAPLKLSLEMAAGRAALGIESLSLESGEDDGQVFLRYQQDGSENLAPCQDFQWERAFSSPEDFLRTLLDGP